VGASPDARDARLRDADCKGGEAMELMRMIVVFAVVAAPALIAAYILVIWVAAARHTPRSRV
jgi:hypothetical protein